MLMTACITIQANGAASCKPEAPAFRPSVGRRRYIQGRWKCSGQNDVGAADRGSASEVLGPRASLSTTEIESASAAARAISRARRFWALRHPPASTRSVAVTQASAARVIPYLYGGT